jgi:hypothetical protein
MNLTDSRGVLTSVRENMTNKAHVSQVLLDAMPEKAFFDPRNPEHLRAYDVFREHGKWTMKFYTEGQYSTLPATIEKKIIDMVLASVK